MRTIYRLPKINGIKLAGHIANEPVINGSRARFTIIRNFGGDKDEEMNYVDVTVNLFCQDGQFPEYLKKGAAVEISGYFTPNDYVKDDKKIHRVSINIKNNGIKEAEMTVVKDKDGKEHKRLPKVNDVEFCGRLASDPVINGTRVTFTLLRNFGGDKGKADLTFELFCKDGQVPEFIKKGAAVTVNAFCKPNNWVTADGEKRHSIEYIVKEGKDSVSAAQLEKIEIENEAPAADETADVSDEEVIDLKLD